MIEPPGAKHYSGIFPVNNNYKEMAVITAPGVKHSGSLFCLPITESVFLIKMVS